MRLEKKSQANDVQSRADVEIDVGRMTGGTVLGYDVPGGSRAHGRAKIRVGDAENGDIAGVRERGDQKRSGPESVPAGHGAGSRWWRYGVPAAVSVLLGSIVAILINFATAGGSGAASAAGLGAAVAGWAGWEAWRSASSRAN